MASEEAALQLELPGHQVFLFANAETARAAGLYRPHGRNLGLIDTAG
jgi:hypothetical protein